MVVIRKSSQEGAWGGDICVMVVATGIVALMGQGGAWGGDTLVVVVATGIDSPGGTGGWRGLS